MVVVVVVVVVTLTSEWIERVQELFNGGTTVRVANSLLLVGSSTVEIGWSRGH